MPKQSQYLPRKQEIIKVCRQAREDCGVHWMGNASAKLEIPERTLRRLCHQWRVFYTNRQYYRKNKQVILATLERCGTIRKAAAELGIPPTTLQRLREKWIGGIPSRNRSRTWISPDGRKCKVSR